MVIKFNLNSSFKVVPEGNRTLTITKAEAKPSGKPTAIYITWKDSEGGVINDRYDLTREVALTKLGILIRNALNLPDMSEFDTKDIGQLENKVLLCEVAHTQGTQPKEDGSYPVFANIKKIISAAEITTLTAKVGTVVTGDATVGPRDSIMTLDDLD